MNPTIDKKLCIGCGTCEALCPKVFEVKDGDASIKKDAPVEEKGNCIKEAIEACPVDAISNKQ